MKIIQAQHTDEILQVRALFREYAASLSFDLCFQEFQQELAALPGAYGPPEGCLLLARQDDQPAGCVALRKLGEGVAEMKRLFVRPPFRCRGIGRRLTETVIGEARRIGYRSIRLDTVSSMKEANALYRSLGFTETEPYTYNPLPDAVFFQLKLPEQPEP